MKGALRQHAAILAQFARAGCARRVEFRLEFVNQVVMDCCFYLLHVLSFEFLFAHSATIGGWSHAELRVFLGMVFVSDAFHMMWLGAGWMFAGELKDGKLDSLRVRPASPIVLFFFQRFSPEAVLNGALACGYLGWACASAGAVDSPARVAWLAWALALTCFGRVVVIVLFTLLEFRLVNADLARLFNLLGGEAADRPLDVYPQPMRWFLLWLVPIATWSWMPAGMVLARQSVLTSLGYSAFLALFGVLVFRTWRRSFRHYESALS